MEGLEKLTEFIALVWALVKAAPDRLAGIQMAWAALMLWPLKSFHRPDHAVHVRIGPRRHDVDLVLGQANDLGTLRDVYVRRAYALPPSLMPATIVDLGANIGLATRFFLQTQPQARVLAVEPDPRALELLRANVADQDRVEVHAGAVTGGDTRTVELGLATSTVASTVVHPEDVGDESVTVPAFGLDALLAEHGIERADVVKIDVEGAEYDVLANFRGLADVRYITGEFHVQHAGVRPDEFFALLQDFRLKIDADERHWVFWGPRVRP